MRSPTISRSINISLLAEGDAPFTYGPINIALLPEGENSNDRGDGLRDLQRLRRVSLTNNTRPTGNTALLGTFFGEYNAARDPRIIQVAVKFYF